MEKRQAILKLHQEGKSCRDITKALQALNVSKSTVSYTVNRFTKAKSLENRPKSGRPRSVRTKKLIKAARQKISRKSKRSVAKWPRRSEFQELPCGESSEMI